MYPVLCLTGKAHAILAALSHRSIRSVTVVVVVRADLLHQLVVCAEEVNVDADDFKGLGAKP